MSIYPTQKSFSGCCSTEQRVSDKQEAAEETDTQVTCARFTKQVIYSEYTFLT